MHPGRGYMASLMADRGCRVTALSSTPTQLRINLGETVVEVRASDGEDESAGLTCDYGLVVADTCHDSPTALVELWRKASRWLQPAGELLTAVSPGWVPGPVEAEAARLRVVSVPYRRVRRD